MSTVNSMKVSEILAFTLANGLQSEYFRIFNNYQCNLPDKEVVAHISIRASLTKNPDSIAKLKNCGKRVLEKTNLRTKLNLQAKCSSSDVIKVQKELVEEYPFSFQLLHNFIEEYILKNKGIDYDMLDYFRKVYGKVPDAIIVLDLLEIVADLLAGNKFFFYAKSNNWIEKYCTKGPSFFADWNATHLLVSLYKMKHWRAFSWLVYSHVMRVMHGRDTYRINLKEFPSELLCKYKSFFCEHKKKIILKKNIATRPTKFFVNFAC
ncbi:hypothetical protein SAMN05660337_0599 [Maridesulfovibrio ferrireducens]|uniref:Uncharacterized protein n=1 Tax=Maridesulfovibrio ferrireducens TaxID=246191 RepID=A0A1G9C9X9_9BACT|nr:hypothetical protein [Maridesulfovibrio ferrireducens]SDK48469.1 hypothetical protein SAMN05660337_0599 [Maridesulfovibrio ferrireducens]